MSVYDVNGFVIAVEGPVDRAFSKDYGHFKIPETPQKTDLFVKVNEAQRFLPTRIRGSPERVYLPFGESENTLWYDERIEPERLSDRFLNGIEFLMWWPGRAWLHAGAVAKKGEAYIFTGDEGVGKTSSVLSLLKQGYDYLSDDWLTIDGDRVFPLPKRVRVFGRNLQDKEIAERVLGYRRLYYLPMSSLLDSGSKFSSHKDVQFVFNKLKERTMLRVEIERMFPQVKVSSPVPISKVFLLERRKVDRVEVKQDISSWELAQKMAYYSMYWWDNMLREYYFYVHQFGVRNRRIEYRLYRDVRIMNEAFGKCHLYRVILPERLDLAKANLISLLGIA